MFKVMDGHPGPAARSHTAAHHRTVRSVTGESARADPRHSSKTATAR